MPFNGRLRVVTPLQAERILAAYLGFDNVVDPQRFVIMWPCIEAAQLLSAFPGLTHENLEFPMIDEASQAAEQNPQVGRLTNHIQNRWVVRVLMVMRHNIGVYQTNTLEQNRARAAAVINNTSATLWIPDHILEEDEFPPSPLSLSP